VTKRAVPTRGSGRLGSLTPSHCGGSAWLTDIVSGIVSKSSDDTMLRFQFG
jgi:hypothetical protein